MLSFLLDSLRHRSLSDKLPIARSDDNRPDLIRFICADPHHRTYIITYDTKIFTGLCMFENANDQKSTTSSDQNNDNVKNKEQNLIINGLTQYASLLEMRKSIPSSRTLVSGMMILAPVHSLLLAFDSRNASDLHHAFQNFSPNNAVLCSAVVRGNTHAAFASR
jgi:hypothetical protein